MAEGNGTERDTSGPGVEDADGSEDLILAQLKRQYTDWEDVTCEARQKSLRDQDYYDGAQWTAAQTEDFAARKQPVITFNRIAPKVNYVLGTEIDSRISPRAYPRTVAHENDATAATDALRYVADADDFDGKRTVVAQEMIVPGAGGVVFSIGKQNRAGIRKIVTNEVTFDRMFWDPASRKPDFSDARYMGLIVWLDVGEVRDMFPKSEVEIESTTSQVSKIGDSGDDKPSTWWDPEKKRIQVIEHYYRDTEGEWFECKYVAGGFLETPRKVELLDDEGHTWCPLWATTSYVARGTNDSNDRYGIVRNLIGAQDEINHRRSKAIHLMHSRAAIGTSGAIASPNEFQRQMSKPDGYYELSPGRKIGEDVKILDNNALVAEQVQMLQEAKNEIDLVGPRPIPAQQQGGDISGRLFIAQQEAGALELKPVFDNLHRWSVGVFKRYWWMIRQYWSHEAWLRVRDDKVDTGYRFVEINRQMTRAQRFQDLTENETDPVEASRIAFGPTGPRMLKQAREGVQAMLQQQLALAQQQGMQVQPPAPQQIEQMAVKALLQSPVGQEQIKVNDVASVDVDIVIETSPRSILLEHEQFMELTGMVREGVIGLTPEIMKAIIQASSLQDKDKIIAMIDKPPSPEEQQAAQQAQQQQQALLQKQLEKLAAEVQKLQAESVKAQAQAQKTAAEAAGEPAATQLDVARAEHARAQATKAAMEAGAASVVTPGGQG